MPTEEMRKWLGIGMLCGLLAQSVSRAQAPATRPAAAPVAVSIHFLNVNQGRAAIVDETNDPYFNLLQPMEMSAKTGGLITGNTIQAERDECRRRYQAAVVGFSPGEKLAIETLVKKITAATQDKFPVFARTPWSFIKIANGLEGGSAFTRGGNIVLPAESVRALLNTSTDKAPRWAVLVQPANLLLCEQLHVVQKAQPERFAKMYEEQWGLKHQDKLEAGEWLTEHQFLDPDAVDEHWIYEVKAGERSRWIWPMLMMGDARDPTGPSMADVQPVAVMLDGSQEQGFQPKPAPNGAPAMQPLLNLPQYASKFSPSEHPFNPAKAAADLFARIIVAEELLPDAKPPGAEAALAKARERFKEMRGWFERILG